MKKILIAMAAMAMLVACGGGDKYYFAEPENRAFNDSTAPFDTLSYVFGVNFALPLEGELAELNYNRELFIEKVSEYLMMDNESFPDIEIMNKDFMKFQQERLRPFIMAKQRNTFTPNNPVEVPEVYNEEYDSVMFTNWMAVMASNSVREIAAPVNVHYVVEGIRDMAGVNNIAYLDSLTKISQKQYMSQLRSYYSNELSKYNIERSEAWLADVAKQPGVQALAVGDNTIYYRINNEGGVRTSEPTDSVALEYEIYNYRGKLIQSTESRFEPVKQRIAELKADKEMPDSVRFAQIRQAQEYMEKLRVPINTIRNIRIEAIKHCLPLVGEFGSITIWAPAKYAPQSRQFMPGEAIVINLDVKRIAKGTSVDGAKPAMKLKPSQPGAPVKVVTTTDGGQVAPVKKEGNK